MNALNSILHITIISAPILGLFYGLNKLTHGFTKDAVVSKITNNKTIIYSRLLVFATGVLFIFILIAGLDKSGKEYGLAIPNQAFSNWILILVPIILLITFLFSRNKGNFEIYPPVRIKVWTIRQILLNAITWAMYLFGYEFIFRGFLLFESLKYLNTEVSIIFNIVIYGLVHLPKGPKETIGSILFGIILCYSTLHTGSVLTPFLLHTILAASTDVFSVWFNPKIKIRI